MKAQLCIAARTQGADGMSGKRLILYAGIRQGSELLSI
jgi:hypothetical protein